MGDALFHAPLWRPSARTLFHGFGAPRACRYRKERVVSRRVRWYSDGTASAVSTWLDIQQYGSDAGPVVICDTGAEDEDNLRFRGQCAHKFGCEITVIKSEKYDSTLDVWQRVKYMSGHKGAPCSREMKFIPRLNFERASDIHVFGYTADAGDKARAERLAADFPPSSLIVTPLIDQELTKANCMAIVESWGIALPRTYAMGFPNANCLQFGCSKAQSPRYWALFRKCFPDRFAVTAAESRKLGVRLCIIGREKLENGKYRNIRCYIDEIPIDHPTSNPIVPSCDFICSMQQQDLAA